MDKWDTLFAFRNVMILAAAIKPSTRNKGLFSKLGCILAEDRIHSMGGGQSFAADRRGRIYDTEGSVYAAAPLTLCNKIEFVYDESVPSVSASLPITALSVKAGKGETTQTRSSKKNKRRPSLASDQSLSGSVGGSCLPPTLTRTNSLNPRVKKHSKCDSMSMSMSKGDSSANSIIDLDAELDLLQQYGDFSSASDNALMRNMSLNQLCSYVDDEDVATSNSTTATDYGCNITGTGKPAHPAPINLHNAYVVGRAFSYNAYAYNDHVNTPLLGSDSSGNGSGVDVVAASLVVETNANTTADADANVSAVVTDSMDFLVGLTSSSCNIDFSGVSVTEAGTDTEADLNLALDLALDLLDNDFGSCAQLPPMAQEVQM